MRKNIFMFYSNIKSYIYIYISPKGHLWEAGIFFLGKISTSTSEAGAVFCIGTFALDIYAGRKICGGFVVCKCLKKCWEGQVVFQGGEMYTVQTILSLKTNSEFTPEKRWLEDKCPCRMAYFQERTVSFREGNVLIFLAVTKLLVSSKSFPLSELWNLASYGNDVMGPWGDLSWWSIWWKRENKHCFSTLYLVCIARSILPIFAGCWVQIPYKDTNPLKQD